MKNREFENKYHALFDKALEGILLLDPKTHRIEEVNMRAQVILGMSESKVIKKELGIFTDKAKIIETIEKVISKKKNQKFDTELLLPKSKKISVSVNIDFLEIKGRSFVILIIRDLTPLRAFEAEVRKLSDERIEDLKIALESLHKTNQLKSDFVSMVSHEIRNPLSVLKSAIEILKRSDLSKSKHDEIVALSSHHIERMIAISSNLLDISKVEAGVMHYHYEKVPIKKILKRIVKHHLSLAKELEIEISEDCESDVYAYADEHKTEQIFNNLISNAFKVTPKKGQVSLFAKNLENGQVELGVKDTGCGIAADKMNLLFKRFSRIHTNLEGGSKTKGTGLGLNIVKSLVEAQDGSIWATSRVGQGTTFFFTLPQTGIPVVAVIEEDEKFSNKIATFLEDEGFEVNQCHSAFRFIEETSKINPNIVVLCSETPDLNSLEIIKRTQALAQFKDVPFVILEDVAHRVSKKSKLKNTIVIRKKEWQEELMFAIKKFIRTQVHRELK